MLTRMRETSQYGGWGAITALSPTVRRRTPQLNAVFAFGRRTSLAVQPLLKMRVIAHARWTLLPSSTEPKYLLFETNWSGADQTYIPDLARVMPTQWQSIWGATTGFPGPAPTSRLLAHVEEVDHGTDHYWTDYDEAATTQTVLQALKLRSEVERFAQRSVGLSPAAFAERWKRLIVRVQHLL